MLIAQEQIATGFAHWLADHVTEKWMALAGLNIAFFLLAAVMDEIAIMVILGPMLIAIATKLRRRSDSLRRHHRHQRRDRHGGAADRLLPVRRHGDLGAQLGADIAGDLAADPA